ncbi:MAG: hypothetical protein AAGJ83_13370, partial [Planctomycetota bacterium]
MAIRYTATAPYGGNDLTRFYPYSSDLQLPVDAAAKLQPRGFAATYEITGAIPTPRHSVATFEVHETR